MCDCASIDDIEHFGPVVVDFVANEPLRNQKDYFLDIQIYFACVGHQGYPAALSPFWNIFLLACFDKQASPVLPEP